MNRKRIIGSILILVIVGSSIGFVTVVLPAWRGSPSPLRIEEQKDSAIAESGVEGHRNLRFRNPGNKPLSMRLERTDCECAHVQVCLAPDDWKGLDSPAFLSRGTDPSLAWHKLERNGQPFEVPPRSQGMIRVTWKAFRLGATAIGIDLIVGDGEKEVSQRFEAPVNFIAPVFFCSEDDPKATEIDVGRLKAGEERTARYLCCSTTRDEFTLTPMPSSDPCIRYGAPQPLTSEELRVLSQKGGADPVRAGFRVQVTVREQADGHRLDIGPFHRRIVYKSNVYEDHQVTTHVNGTVAGEIGLADSQGKDHIDCGMILPNEPKPLTFSLESSDPQLELSVDEERTLPFFKVELIDGKQGKRSEKGKRWQVRVEFRKDALFRGEFPNSTRPGYDSADLCSLVFILTHSGGSPSMERRLFVPVRGNVRLY